MTPALRAAPGLADWAKIVALTAVRRVNHRSLERWSRWTYRVGADRTLHSAATTELARDHYRNPGLPAEVRVLAPLPRESRLARSYVLPYYGLASVAFKAHRWKPIRKCAWRSTARYAGIFPGNDEGWGDIQADDQFARLRLQGPNPFLLRYEGGRFVVDYGPGFENVWEPVRCVFELRHERFVATGIEMGGRMIRPSEPGWWRAKLTANALDARYAIFGQHLMTCHFLIAQAFAIAAHDLPRNHRLAPVIRLCTDGVLEVNDFALRLLLNNDSYFLQSNFIPQDALFQILRNRARHFSPLELEPLRDIAERGLCMIPNHPYVEDASHAWSVISDFTGRLARAHYASDAEVAADRDLQAWHLCLRGLVPKCADLHLRTRDDLTTRLASMIYANVVHEVSGDYSPYTGARARASKQLVNFMGLKKAFPPRPLLADVFLFEQGAYAGRFNVAGNNLMDTPIERRLDGKDLAITRRFLRELRRYERAVDERNQDRVQPFLRMRPSQWEWSVSF